MTPTEQDLARELARHPKWRWMRGMVVDTVRTIDGKDVVFEVDNVEPGSPMVMGALFRITTPTSPTRRLKDA